MTRQLVIGIASCALLATAFPIAAQQEREFEFVSLRRSIPTTGGTGASVPRSEVLVLPGGRFEARGQALANLARVAFGFDHVDPNRGLVQADGWMWNDRFDVTASAGAEWTTPPTGSRVPTELREMLKALLADRFELRARIATKNVDVTAVRLANANQLGPGLRPSTASCRGPFTDASPDDASPTPRCPLINTGERIAAQAISLQDAVNLIGQMPFFRSFGAIVDQTGLQGLYDVSFSIPRGSISRESLQGEFESQLGLQMKGTSMPLPALILEKARKPKED